MEIVGGTFFTYGTERMTVSMHVDSEKTEVSLMRSKVGRAKPSIGYYA